MTTFFITYFACLLATLTAGCLIGMLVDKTDTGKRIKANHGPNADQMKCDHDWLNWSHPQPVKDDTKSSDWEQMMGSISARGYRPTMEQYRLCSKCNLQQRSLT